VISSRAGELIEIGDGFGIPGTWLLRSGRAAPRRGRQRTNRKPPAARDYEGAVRPEDCDPLAAVNQ